jgi:hypothetical protein
VVCIEPGTSAVALGGEYAGGALVSAGGGRLVGVVVVKGLGEPIVLVVEVVERACLTELKDEVLIDADIRLVFDSLLEPNFLKKEGILVGVA